MGINIFIDINIFELIYIFYVINNYYLFFDFLRTIIYTNLYANCCYI